MSQVPATGEIERRVTRPRDEPVVGGRDIVDRVGGAHGAPHRAGRRVAGPPRIVEMARSASPRRALVTLAAAQEEQGAAVVAAVRTSV